MVTDTFSQGEPRVLGLAMIPGHHVISIEVEADSLEDSQGFGAKHWQNVWLTSFTLTLSCWAWTSRRILTLTSTDAVSGLNNEEMAFWSNSQPARCFQDGSGKNRTFKGVCDNVFVRFKIFILCFSHLNIKLTRFHSQDSFFCLQFVLCYAF